MPNAPKRRFVELNVDEVSLVDSPANEEEFAVIKSLTAQEDEMSDDKTKAAEEATEGTTTEEETTEGTAADDKAEKVEVDAEKPADEGVEKAMAQVVNLVENIAKAAGVKADDAEEDDATEEETEKGAMFGASGIRDLFQKQLKKAGVKGDALKAAMAEFDKDAKAKDDAKADAKADDKKADEKKTKKAADVKPEDAPEDADTDADDEVVKTLDVIENAIQKAKRFTPKREEALKAVVDQLSTLLKELTGAKKAQLPSGTQFGASGIQDLTVAVKKLADAFTAHTEATAETTKALEDRIKDIEKERQPSTSIDGDDTDKEEETEKSLWSGVL